MGWLGRVFGFWGETQPWCALMTVITTPTLARLQTFHFWSQRFSFIFWCLFWIRTTNRIGSKFGIFVFLHASINLKLAFHLKMNSNHYNPIHVLATGNPQIRIATVIIIKVLQAKIIWSRVADSIRVWLPPIPKAVHLALQPPPCVKCSFWIIKSKNWAGAMCFVQRSYCIMGSKSLACELHFVLYGSCWFNAFDHFSRSHWTKVELVSE